MRVRLWVVPIVTIAVLFGAWGIGRATGVWSTSGRQQIVPGQQITVNDIKGWMTIQQAADGLQIEAQEIIGLLDIPEGAAVSPDTAFRDLEALIPVFELSTFRAVLSAYLSGGSAPPATPTSIPTSTGTASGGGGTPTGTGAPGSGSEQSITGSTTLRQVAKANALDVQTLIAESGLPADTDPDATLKQIRESTPGFEIQTVRDVVTRLKAGG